ncbi:MAG: extracellular solute-binding protein [Eubacteriales bacterium]
MKKRILAGILASTMILGSLVSCSSGDDGSSGGGTSGGGSSSSNTGGTPVAPEDFFPIADPITVSIAGRHQDGTNPQADQQFYIDLQGETGINIEWIDWPTSQHAEKMSLAFAGNTVPDALYGDYIVTSAQAVEYGSDGWLLPLNDYITPEYMPNFCEVLEKRPEVLDSITAPDGNIYALPQILESTGESSNSTMLINTEWLAQVGKEMPTTISEFHDVLLAFKNAGDLNGNGLADEIPFTFQFNDGNTGQWDLMGWTGLVANNQHQRMTRKDGEVVFMPMVDEYKEWLEYMHLLYADGLIDPEAFTMTGSAYNAKIKTAEPTCGVVMAWNAEQINALLPDNDLTQDGVYQFVAPLDGENGVDPVWGPRIKAPNRILNFVINADTDYAEELVRWADLHYDVDTSIEIRLGLIGTHINEVEPGYYEKLNNADGVPFTDIEKSVYVPTVSALCSVLIDDFLWYGDIMPQSKAGASVFYEDYLFEDYVKASAMTTLEESDLSNKIMPDMKSVVDQATAKFITQGGIDAGWDSYLADLEKIGIQEYIDLWTEIDARSPV